MSRLQFQNKHQLRQNPSKTFDGAASQSIQQPLFGFNVALGASPVLGTLTPNTAFGRTPSAYCVAIAGDSFSRSKSYIVLAVLSTKEPPTLKATTPTSKAK